MQALFNKKIGSNLNKRLNHFLFKYENLTMKLIFASFNKIEDALRSLLSLKSILNSTSAKIMLKSFTAQEKVTNRLD